MPSKSPEMIGLPGFLGFEAIVGLVRTADDSGMLNSAAASWSSADDAFSDIAQEHDHWCWAAVTAAIHKRVIGVTLAQCEVVRRFRDAGFMVHNGATISGSPCAEPERFDFDEDISSALSAVSQLSVGIRSRNDDPTPDIVAFANAHLNHDPPLPMPVLIRYPSHGGTGSNHYICILGRAPGQDRFRIFDPAEGAGSVVCGVAELNDYNESGERGRWLDFYSWAEIG